MKKEKKKTNDQEREKKSLLKVSEKEAFGKDFLADLGL